MMETFALWYLDTHYFVRFLFVLFCIGIFSILKSIITSFIQKQKQSEQIFRVLRVGKIVFECTVSLLTIRLGFWFYQETHSIFRSLIIGASLPLLFGANYFFRSKSKKNLYKKTY